MDGTIRQSELRNNNAEIMRRVAEGESFTVTVHGRAVADLVPHQRDAASRQRLVPAAVVDQLLAGDVPGPDPEAWERDMADAAEMFGDEDRQPADPWEPRSR
ncbi:type II toxin-antitoxin system Phd/YefM family antitoxin [Pseudonocardia sichuanensis]